MSQPASAEGKGHADELPSASITRSEPGRPRRSRSDGRVRAGLESDADGSSWILGAARLGMLGIPLNVVLMGDLSSRRRRRTEGGFGPRADLISPPR